MWRGDLKCDLSHAPRGNASRDALRHLTQPWDAERPGRHSHAERGNDHRAAWRGSSTLKAIQPVPGICCRPHTGFKYEVGSRPPARDESAEYPKPSCQPSHQVGYRRSALLE